MPFDWSDIMRDDSSEFDPIATPARRKRTRTNAGISSDDEAEAHNTTPLTAPNANLVALASRVAQAKKLKAEQAHELEDFARDPLHAQNIKIYAGLLALANQSDKLIPPAAAFEVSKALQTNLTSYAHGVLFSTKISSYKGTVPINHLLEIVKKFRFDLPPDIDTDRAKARKLHHAAGEALTQVRGKIKKLLIKGTKGSNAKQHQDIFDLTKSITHKTEYKITVQLMARVALMRAVFDEVKGDDYWDKVDERLAQINTSKKDPEALARTFSRLLQADRKVHGTGAKYVVEDTEDALQNKIDASIEEAAARVKAAAAAEEEEDNDDDGQEGRTPEVPGASDLQTPEADSSGTANA